MRNLKKVLALVLAMAMSLSLAVTASASYNTFDDQDKIENQEAVFLLNALDIVEGRETGDFDPAANINRAEAAKLVAALNLAGVPVPNAKGVSSFSDVLGDGSVAWANNYIEYGVSQGSINGMGDGTFAPKANVTGVQFAKMLLGILGYDAAEEGYTGTNWMYNVNIDAVDAGLYRGLDIDATAALSRDDAAQMMYNALKAYTVIYLTDTTGALEITKTPLLKDKYPTIRIDKTAVITGIEYNVDEAEYTYTFDADLSFKDDINPDNKLTCEEDYTDLLLMNVMVVYDVVEGVQGMYAFENNVETGLCGDFDDSDDNKKIEFGETKYVQFSVKCAPVSGDEIHSTVLSTPSDVLYACDYEAYKAIDNDNDGVYDFVIVYLVDIETVTYVNSARVETTHVGNAGAADGKYKFEDNTISTGLAVEDTVAIYGDTSLKTWNVVEKIAEQSGVVNTVRANDGDITAFVINGKTYYACDRFNCTPELWQNPLHNWPGKAVNFYVFNGYLVNVAEDVSLTRDYLLITSIAHGTNNDGTSVNAKAVLGDGTAADITIASLDVWTSELKGLAMISEIEGYLEQTDIDPQVGYLARYEVVDGKYELTSTYALDEMVDDGDADLGFYGTVGNYDGYIPYFAAATNEEYGFIVADGKEIRIAPDAQVFLVDHDATFNGVTTTNHKVSYSVVSGADIANMTGYTHVNYVGYEKAADGFYYATLLYIETALQYMSGTQYGIIVSEPQYEGNFDNDELNEFVYFDLFDGEKTVPVKVHVHYLGEIPEPALDKGDLISFKVDADELYDVEIINMSADEDDNGKLTQFVAAITGCSDFPYADLKLSIDGTEANELPYDLADNAKIFIFNTEDCVPAEGGLAISNFEKVGDTTIYDKNAFVMLNDAGEVALIVFDAAAETL